MVPQRARWLTDLSDSPVTCPSLQLYLIGPIARLVMTTKVVPKPSSARARAREEHPMRISRVVLAAAVLAVMALGAVPASPAFAQIAFRTADFSGYATGSAVHLDALQLGATGPVVANGDEAFSSATVASQG